MSYVHIMELCHFLENRCCGHSTFVLQITDVRTTLLAHQQHTIISATEVYSNKSYKYNQQIYETSDECLAEYAMISE